MDAAMPHPSPYLFFLLVFLFSVPVYAAGLAAPYSAVMVVVPITAAVLLTVREEGIPGVQGLVLRAFDYRKICGRVWYLPVLFLMPTVVLISAGSMILAGVPVAGPQVSPFLLPVYFTVFFFMAIGEEAGWSGYALGPLRARSGALGAALLIGVVWALWHAIPYALAHPPLWVAAQCATTVLLRILMVWIFCNNGGSVFSMVVFHAIVNLSTVPAYGVPYDPVPVSIVLGVMVAGILVAYDPATFRRRLPRAGQDLATADNR